MDSFERRQEFSMEYRLRRADGEYRWLFNKGAPRFGTDGVFLGYMGSAVDITERKRTESQANAQYAATRILSESTSMAEAAPKIIESVCRCLDWQFGEMWFVDRKTKLLVSLSSWHLPAADLAAFSPVGTQLAVVPGVGLLGGVWRSGRPAGTCDLTGERDFHYASLAAKAGLRSAFAFPVLLGEEVLGVTVFLSYEIREPDEDLLQMMSSIGSQMGQFADRKLMEEGLRDSEARLQLAMEVSRIGYWDLDVSTGKIARSESMDHILGMPPGTLGSTQAEFLKLIHPEDREKLRVGGERIRQALKVSDIEYRIVRPDGSIRWIASRGQAILGPDGGVSRLLGLSADITEHKLAEEALRESEERLRLALEAGRMGVWDWNRRTNTVTWSKEQFTIMGLVPFSVEPDYHTWANCVYPEDLSRAEALMTRAISDRKDYQSEHLVRLADGGIRWVEEKGAPIYNETGECVHVRGVTIDITERKRTEQELIMALAEVGRLKERLEAENVYLRSEVLEAHRDGEIIGESPGIERVLAEVERVAGTDMTVLAVGETGTGKELVARLVHEKSDRRERPLVKVNCSALPAELIESELFGHERGAFTGAVSKQMGRFELADRGTIFLDEIGELPLRLQSKLLRVLQEGEFERLGSGKTIKVDVRVIAATNRNLNEAAQQGRFRADLYYRLNVYPIEIPALRERVEDIGLMAEVFLQEAGRRLGKSFGKIPSAVIEALKEYSWPGNVRELENVIGRAALTTTGLNLQLPAGWNQVPLAGASFKPSSAGVNLTKSKSKEGASPLTLEQFERTRIFEVLRETNWRIEGPKGAALILGLHPNTLRSRMNKLEIRKPT